MRKSQTVLAILAAILVSATVANAEMTEEEKAMFKRLEQRVAAQDKKIAQLQGTLSDEARKKARHEEIRQVLKELNADLDQRAAAGWLENFKISFISVHIIHKRKTM